MCHENEVRIPHRQPDVNKDQEQVQVECVQNQSKSGCPEGNVNQSELDPEGHKSYVLGTTPHRTEAHMFRCCRIQGTWTVWRGVSPGGSVVRGSLIWLQPERRRTWRPEIQTTRVPGEKKEGTSQREREGRRADS